VHLKQRHDTVDHCVFALLDSISCMQTGNAFQEMSTALCKDTAFAQAGMHKAA